MTRRLHVAMIIILASAASLSGQEKKDAPQVIVASPLGVPTGKATKLTLRGLKLDTATDVRIRTPKATAKVLSKGKATVPNMQDPRKVGDTQIEVELTLAADAPED